MTPATAALLTEFDRLAASGRRIDLWWRDDDAVTCSKALDRLIAITGAASVPLSLAVVPSAADASLADRVRDESDLTILVHGWSHANHAEPGERKSEFGPHRSPAEMSRDVEAGLAATRGRFGEQAASVFVPPWNRMAPPLPPLLRQAGFRAVSCFGEARSDHPIARLDTHLDPVDWRGSRGLAAPEAMTAMMGRALARGAEFLGVLTHHLVFDGPLWAFCEEFAAIAATHPAVRPVGIRDILASQSLSDMVREPAAQET